MPAPAPPSKGQRTISSFFASSSSATKKRRDDDGVDGVDDGPVVIDGDDENVAPKRVKTDARASSETPTTVEAREGGDETARGPAPARSVEETLAALTPSSPGTREKFVQKLSLDRRRRDLEVDGGEGGKNGGGASSSSAVVGGKGGATMKMTPLELSVKSFKAKYPGTLLMIEVGYKYHFYGDDARDASKVLGIFAYQSRNYLTASVPVVRLHVYVRRLVKAGFRVGVVKQTETAALKASGESASGNKGGLFERQLVGLYTKATLDAGAALSNAGGDGEKSSASWNLSNYLLCVAEERAGGSTTRIGLAAIDTSTGDVLNGEFVDTLQRPGLESRLLCISPAEIVLVEPISEPTVRLIKALYGSGKNAARIEYLTRDALANVELTGVKAEEATPLVHTALCAGSKYLSDFGQSDILKLDAAFRPLEGVDEMKLSPNVLKQLEVLTSSAGSYKGSLLWLMNHTITPMGGRLLRHWVSHPLRSKAVIERRLDAVEALRELTEFENGAMMDHDKASHNKFEGLKVQLKQLPDLQKYLARVFHGTATPAEFVSALTSLSKFGEACGSMRASVATEIESALLNELLEVIADPMLGALADRFLSALNLDVACDEKPSKTKIGLFHDDPSRFPDLHAATVAVEDGKTAMDDLLPELRRKLGMPRLGYTTVGGVGGGEWLIEVPMDRSCPNTWIKVSSNKSKKVVRYHPPEVTEAAAALECANEKHTIAADAAWKEFLASFREHYTTFKSATSAVATLDSLHALAILSRNEGYVRPQLLDDAAPPSLEIIDGRHPVLDAHLLDDFVPNSIELHSERTRALVITGPNMGGKSCYIRQVALLSIMAQVGSFVPAKQATLTVLDAVYARMGASDNLAMGSSTFLEEMSEASNILETCTPRSLVIMDELGRGTSTHDGVAIANATLEHLVRDAKCFTLFVTHYPSVARDVQAKYPSHCSSCFASYVELPGSSEEMPRIQFLYKLTPGVAHRSFGLNVARMACLPSEVIHTASVKASELEIITAERALARRAFDAAARDAAARDATRVLTAIDSGDATTMRTARDALTATDITDA